MIGSKYLSEVVNPNNFQKGCINAITANVGSGKSFFALKELPKYVPKDKHMLYLTDTCMNRDQILATCDNVRAYDKEWRKWINKQAKLIWGTLPFDFSNEDITVMNFAQVGAILFYGHEFDWSAFEYVIVDEIHNLINYKKIKPKLSAEQIANNEEVVNLCDITINKIKDTLSRYPDVKIIGMSATPRNIYHDFPCIHPVLSKQDHDVLKRYVNFQEFYYRDYMKVLRDIPIGSKGIIYFDRINALTKVESILTEIGHNTASFWSLKNTDWEMTQRQKDVRRYIVENQMIPPDVDILLINGACQTGVNIKNTDIRFILVHSENQDLITQVRGRLRDDLNSLLFFNSKSVDITVPVPDEYLNVPLTVEKTSALCDIIRLMKPNRKNEYYKWAKVKDYLNENGYKCVNKSMGHGGSSKYWFITKE